MDGVYCLDILLVVSTENLTAKTPVALQMTRP